MQYNSFLFDKTKNRKNQNDQVFTGFFVKSHTAVNSNATSKGKWFHCVSLKLCKIAGYLCSAHKLTTQSAALRF